jgi:putative transcriptional regulator
VRLPLAAFCLMLLALALPARAVDAPKAGQFQGKLLVATKHNPDLRFDRAVVYMVKHTSRTAYGIVVNKPYGKGKIADLMKGLGLEPTKATRKLMLHYGGPVAYKHAFILHSSEYEHPRAEYIDGIVTFTKDASILKKYAEGEGPRRLLVALGYAGWSGQQLEGEILRGFWTVAESSEDLVFGDDKGDLWRRMVERKEVPL